MTSETIIGFFCICFFSCLFNQWWRTHSPEAKRLAQLERKVSQIVERLGIEPDPIDQQVREEIVQGRKINAIKLYREQTGISLREAKDAVDAMEVQIKAQKLV